MEFWNSRIKAICVSDAGVHEVNIFWDLKPRIYCPAVLAYFDEIGYDVSIIISKWFLTLFAYVVTRRMNHG